MIRQEKVLSIVNEHHYKPDYFASNVINRHSKTIGMIVPDVTDFFFSKLIEGVESYLNPLGYVIMLCNSRHSQENEIKYLQELSHRSVDGILLATPNILPEKYALDSGFYQKMPIILIDRGLNRRDNGRLIVKEYEGAYQAVSLFIENGHTKIGMLKETTGYYQLEERFNGYRHALKDHGLPFNGKFVEHGELTVQGGYTASKNYSNIKISRLFFAGMMPWRSDAIRRSMNWAKNPRRYLSHRIRWIKAVRIHDSAIDDSAAAKF